MSHFQAAGMPWQSLSFLREFVSLLLRCGCKSPLPRRFVLKMCDLTRKKVQSWHGPDSRIRLEIQLNLTEIHQRFAADHETGFARERYRFQRFPTAKVPGRKTMPIKMPRS